MYADSSVELVKMDLSVHPSVTLYALNSSKPLNGFVTKFGIREFIQNTQSNFSLNLGRATGGTTLYEDLTFPYARISSEIH